MSLSLNAEQKNILDLFVNEKHYVIPGYQRPYSWSEDECVQFYRDLYGAYRKDEDYFIGNLVLANGRKSKNEFEVVDGQQRLITLWILLFVAYKLLPGLERLERALFIDGWSVNDRSLRIGSMVFESQDEDKLLELSEMDASQISRLNELKLKQSGNVSKLINSSLIDNNAGRFYEMLNYLVDREGQERAKDFVRYIVDRVYLLPIELTGEDPEKASMQALSIFETINDRGLNLEDADIFKEKLYNRSLAANHGDDFIAKWAELRTTCSGLGLKIDDIFRYYLHILRGQNNDPGYDQNLRDYFTLNSASPLLNESYDKVLSDLGRIIEAVSWLRANSLKNNKLGAWIQLVYAYSNQYPQYAAIAFLYQNQVPDEERFIVFLQSLVRYCYFKGATTSVSNEIYNIICKVMHNKEIDGYYKRQISDSMFDSLRKMRIPFALLAYYLDNPKGLTFYSVDRILSQRDIGDLQPQDIDMFEKTDAMNCLGNAIVIDSPRRYVDFYRKCELYADSGLKEVHKVFNDVHFPNFNWINSRNDKIKRRLIKFFKGER